MTTRLFGLPAVLLWMFAAALAAVPTIANAYCGDGVIDGNEQCDIGTLPSEFEDDEYMNTIGCINCVETSGYDCDESEPSICTPVCGDGLVRPHEQCDDGNTDDGDDCNADCTWAGADACGCGEESTCLAAGSSSSADSSEESSAEASSEPPSSSGGGASSSDATAGGPGGRSGPLGCCCWPDGETAITSIDACQANTMFRSGGTYTRLDEDRHLNNTQALRDECAASCAATIASRTTDPDDENVLPGGTGGISPSECVAPTLARIFGDELGNVRNGCDLTDCIPGGDAGTDITEDGVDVCLEIDPDRALTFTDLDANDPWTPFILALKNVRIRDAGDYVFSGYHNHSTGRQQSYFQTGAWEFQPDRGITRLEAVKTTMVAMCISVPDQIPAPLDGVAFKDLPLSTPASDDLAHFAARVFYEAKNRGIVTGDGEGNARPYDIVTLPETLALLFRTSDVIPERLLTKIPQGEWYESYMSFAHRNDLIPTEAERAPSSIVLRDHYAALLLRTLAMHPDPEIHGFIERLDIDTQRLNPAQPIYTPMPNYEDFGEDACVDDNTDGTLRAMNVCPVRG